MAILLAGCNVALQDGQKAGADPVVFKGPGVDCMDTTLPAVQKFFEGTAKSSEIDAAWTCLSGALQTFEDHVQGENRDRYSAVELRRFIEYYFLKDKRISDPLLTEIMRLKQTILGGEIDSLTRDDLKQIYVVLNTLRVETGKLAPYMRIITTQLSKPKTDEERAYVENGLAQITGSARVLGSMLGKSQQPYLMSDAETLLREFGLFIKKGNGHWDGPENLIKHLSLVSALKAFFLLPTGSAIAPDEWQELVSKAARLYGLYARANLLFQGTIVENSGLKQMAIFATEAFAILEDSIRVKPTKTIEFQQIDTLITEIYKVEGLKLPVTELTVKNVFRFLLQKVCNPAVDGVRPNVYGMTIDGLQWLKKDFFGWQEMQGTWAVLANGTDAPTVQQIRDRWSSIKFDYPDSAEEFEYLMKRPFPLVYRGRDNVVFDRPVTGLKVDFRSWNALNWKRAIARLLTRGYTMNFPADKFTGVTKSQFKEAWDDATPVLFELKVINASDYELWTTTFDEANIFEFSADGNTILSYAEGVEALSFVLSGSRISYPNFLELQAHCKQVGQDKMGSAQLDFTCSRDRIKAQYKKYFSNFPYWVELMDGLKGEKMDEFLETMFIAAKGPEEKNGPVMLKNLVKSTVIMEYIESLFLRFDADNSRTLSLKESQNAYPLLRDILKGLSGFDNENDLMALFTYLIKYGESPDKNLGNKIKWLIWKNTKSSWKYEADRQQILRVVSNL